MKRYHAPMLTSPCAALNAADINQDADEDAAQRVERWEDQRENESRAVR